MRDSSQKKRRLPPWEKLVRYIQLLRNDESKEMLKFLGFVVVAALFWLMQSLNGVGEATYRIPVEVVNIPPRVMLTSDVPTHLEVRVVDKGRMLVKYYLEDFPPITVDFPKYQQSNGELNLDYNQLISLVQKKLGTTTTIVSISPEKILLYYATGGGKRVPVVSHYAVRIGLNYVLSGQINLTPDTVTAYGPSWLLARVTRANTDSIVTAHLTDTLDYTLSLTQLPGIRFVPDKIRMLVPVEEIAAGEMNLPVVQTNVPDNQTLITFPSSVKMYYASSLSHFTHITSDDFVIAVDYNSIGQSASKKLPINIIRMPRQVRNLTLSVDSVEYILEERTSL